jgi:hypothetical protein
MTFTLNGCGTHLIGARQLTSVEFDKWSIDLPVKPYKPHPQFYIGTETIVLLFLPVIPLKTFVYYHTDSNHYVPCFYPSGGGVYWPHVKNRWEFYIIPGIFLIYFIIWLFSFIAGKT